MAKKVITRSAPLGLRFFPHVKEALQKAASEEQRPVASLVEMIVTDWLKAKGYLKKSQVADR